MKLKTILLYICVSLFAFPCGLFAQAKDGKPKMVLTQNTFNAGEVYRAGKPIEHAFVIKNTGTADLKIMEVSPG